MKSYQQKFIDIALEKEVLKFGSFTLKSGRQSPYFFNAGLFCTGESMQSLAECYAQSIVESGIVFDVIFGPAYKGIPIVAAIAMELYTKHGMNVGYAYDRKEKKDHGEGGVLVGATVKHKKVLIIDDVISAGVSIEGSLRLLNAENAQVVGVSLSLDREEKGMDSNLSAIQNIEFRYGFPIFSIVKVSDIIEYFKNKNEYSEQLGNFIAYQKEYGVN